MRTYNIRPATQHDILEVYGHTIPNAHRAWAVDWEGKAACVAGVIFLNGNTMAFSSIIDGINPPAITIWRAAKELMDRIKSLGKPVTAICTGKFMNSGAFLERLGFNYKTTLSDGEVYQWLTH